VHVDVAQRAFLPSQSVVVDSSWGPVAVHVVLAGSSVVRLAADLAECGALAASAGCDAAAVAAEAEELLQQGLESGAVSLGLEFLS
jgi:hypothetical protein